MFNDLVHRLRALLRSKAVEQELDDELNFHLVQQAGKYMRAGLSPEEANRMARLSLQGPEQAKEACRDARGISLWVTTMQDLRYGFRQLGRNPGFAAVATLVLALGIGANTAIFSLLDAVMLRSLPVRDPQQLVVPKWTAKATPHPFGSSSFEPCFESKSPKKEDNCSFSYPVFKLIESRSDIFSGVTAFAGPAQLNVKASGAAQLVSGEIVSGSFFQTLGVRAALGRVLDKHDDSPGANAAAVLSYGYWQSAFGGDRSALGEAIRLNGVPFTVVGVAEPSFNRLSPGKVCELWLPIQAAIALGINWIPAPLESGHDWWLKIIGRVRPGVQIPQVEAALTALFRSEMIDQAKLLKPDSDPAIEVAGANRALVGLREMLAKPLYVLMCAVAIILLIACANLAGLFTARTTARQRELAIRRAIGAGRGRIVRQLLTESLLLAALGGLVGIGLAYWGTRLLTAFLSLEIHLDVKPDPRILLFTIVISIASGLFFGIIPAFRSTRLDPTSAINNGTGLQQAMSSASRRLWFSNSLVVAQVALAMVMLFGAGLLMQTLNNLQNTNAGFDSRNLLLFGLDPVSSRYKEPEIRNLYRNLYDRLRSLPGVTNVSYSSDALLAGGLSSSIYKIEGRSERSAVTVYMLGVGPNFFRTMKIPVLAGRVFTAAEFASSRPVAVVNRAFATRYLRGRNPLGLHFGDTGPKDVQQEIVGVVGDAKYNSLRDEIQPTAYVPLKQGGAHFELRTAGNPAALIPAVRNTVRELDPNLPLFDVKTQTEQIDQLLFTERLVTRLSVAFGLLALVLTCVGLYGLLSYEVTRRTREIGIRIAIGAEPGKVQGAVLRETVKLVLIGLVLGLPIALLLTRALATMLYGVQPNDPATLSVAVLVLLFTAALAGYLPARRASRVDPMIALRYE